MGEDLVGGAGAGAQRAFHQARPGPGGVLPGEVDPAQGRGHQAREPGPGHHHPHARILSYLAIGPVARSLRAMAQA